MKAVGKSGVAHHAAARTRLRGDAAGGLILGLLGWYVARQLNLRGIVPALRASEYDLLVAGLLGALIAVTRFRSALWVANGLLCVVVLVVAYTPLIADPARALIRQDPLRKCEAAVVLSANLFRDGSLDGVIQDRLLRSVELVRQGYAPRLILTRLPPPTESSLPAVRRLLSGLGLEIPLDEVGPVRNTGDEALAVRDLARKRGWEQLLLVTSPLHTRRAGAVFEKAGLSVLVRPSAEHRYDLSALDRPGVRLRVFGDWLYESLGWHTYRLRGRL
jgi:uncharacterized SAM-binding protein YcdF (DUF218 family)